MTLKEMIPLAHQGIKMTQTYFHPEEWLIMEGNMVIFEDGVQILLEEWVKDKEWLNEGWEKYEEDYRNDPKYQENNNPYL